MPAPSKVALEDVLWKDSKPRCSARKKTCRACDYRFSKEDYPRLDCPECGEDRRCLYVVREAGIRCTRRHGGNSLKGAASPSFTHGRRSRYHKVMPDELRDYVEKLSADRDLLSMADEIEMLEGIFGKMADSVGIEAGWSKTTDVFAASINYQRALSAITPGSRPTPTQSGRIRETQTIMLDLIKEMNDEASTLKDMVDLMLKMSQLKTREHKRLVDLYQMVPLADVAVWYEQVQGAIRQVCSPEQAQEIAVLLTAGQKMEAFR